MKKIRYAALAALAAVALPATAQWMAPPKAPWYFGAGVGQGHLNRSGSDLTGLANADLDTNETAYNIRLGYMFSPYWGVEAAYYDFGKYAFHGRTVGGTLDVDGEAKAKTAGVNLVGNLPLSPAFDLYGKIGWTRSELKVNASAPLAPTPVNVKDKENGALYGVGGRWNFMPNLGLYLEWAKADKIRVDSWLIGVDFRF